MSGQIQILTETARAKVNLTLHVGAVDADGYHSLQSLVMFADIGDELVLQTADQTGLSIEGPFAEGLLNQGENSILNAAYLCAPENPSQFKLIKNLPVASGLGGGTADAAAAVRLMDRVYGIDEKTPIHKLGADVSVCFLSQTCWMEGIGHQLTPLPEQGQLPAILINPHVHISTGAIFKQFDILGESTEFLKKRDGDTVLDIAKAGRNDLQNVAVRLAPIIQTVLDKIESQNGCQLARMSGSGATCFGIFATRLEAEQAAHALKEHHPDWWCVSTLLGEAK